MSEPKCFYPNGNPSLEEDIPCGTGSAVGCCPLNWSCQPNGLCYLKDQNYYGRYTWTGAPDVLKSAHMTTQLQGTKQSWSVALVATVVIPIDLSLVGALTAVMHRRPDFRSREAPNVVHHRSSKSLLADRYYCTAEQPSFPDVEPPTSPATPISFSMEIEMSFSTSAQSTPTAEVSSPTSPRAPVAQDPSCDSDLGESSCGPICCASSQSCFYPGQCVLNDDRSTSVTPTSTAGDEASDDPVTTTGNSRTSSAESRFTDAKITSTISSFLPSVSVHTIEVASSPSNSDLSTSAFLTITASVTTTSKPTSTPTSVPATPITQSPRFQAGVSVGSIVAAFLLIALIFWCRKKNQTTQPTVYPLAASEAPNVTPYPYDSTQPPIPNPYSQPFPENQPPIASSSSLRPEIRPDHDQGQSRRPMQPQMQHAPAYNPYGFPNTSQSIISQPPLANQDQERMMNSSVSLPPSYTTDDKWRGPRRGA